MSFHPVLTPDFFARHTVDVARDLIGLFLVSPDAGGMIVETEAYREDDPACHAFEGRRSQRNQSMFRPPGTIYIYRIHQVFCLNLSTEAEGRGSAVLIRALEPTEGLEQMLQRRPVSDLRQLSDGPGKLCQALGLNLSHDGQALGTCLHLEDRGRNFPDSAIQATERIGISKARERPWRFWLPPKFRQP